MARESAVKSGAGRRILCLYPAADLQAIQRRCCQGLEAGADDYLTKPCNPAELKARLHTGRRVLQLEDKLVEAREEMRFKATHDGLT